MFDASVAVHMTFESPGGKENGVVDAPLGLQTTDGEESILSVTAMMLDIEMNADEAELLDDAKINGVTFGHTEKNGGSLSTTVTLNEHDEDAPLAPVTGFTAMQLIGVIPNENEVLDAGLQETSTMGTVSVEALVEKLTVRVLLLASVATENEGGHEMLGGDLSTTATINWQVLLLPAASAAKHTNGP